jgi:hypothetical protein
MFGSVIVYAGLISALAGMALVVKPIRRLRVSTRWRAIGVAATGLVLAGIGLILPVSESRVTRATTRLDEFAPVWQFGEFHTIEVAAPPAKVFEAIKKTRPDEMFLFRTLIAIRNIGQPLPQSVQDATRRYESLYDIATNSTFVVLADDPPHEFVLGTVVGWPPGPRPKLTPDFFRKPLPPGFALAAMNCVVTPNGSGSIISTETRVFANSPAARRRFARYWRLIYPGSDLMRRMWLRAYRARATSPTKP